MNASRTAVVSASLALALCLAGPAAAAEGAGETADAIEMAGVQQGASRGGCSRASRAVLDDIGGSVMEDPFLPNAAIGGDNSTDPPGCGRPTRTRVGDAGNPTSRGGTSGPPTSSFTITGTFP